METITSAYSRRISQDESEELRERERRRECRCSCRRFRSSVRFGLFRSFGDERCSCRRLDERRSVSEELEVERVRFSAAFRDELSRSLLAFKEDEALEVAGGFPLVLAFVAAGVFFSDSRDCAPAADAFAATTRAATFAASARRSRAAVRCESDDCEERRARDDPEGSGPATLFAGPSLVMGSD